MEKHLVSEQRKWDFSAGDLQKLRVLLAELRADANDAIGEIESNPPSSVQREAINWADLSCVAASYVIDETTCYWSIMVEEVSPDAIAFQCLMREKLFAAGWLVSVETNW